MQAVAAATTDVIAEALAAAQDAAVDVVPDPLGAAPARPAEALNAVATEVSSSQPDLLIVTTDPAAGASTTPTGGDTFPDPAAADGQQH